MTPKKEDKMTTKEETKVAGDVKDLSVEDVVQSKDFWIALKILDEVSKVKMLEKLLNEEDTAVLRRLFEENLAKPSYKEIKLFHRAMNKLWEEVMCNLGQFHFEHEAHVLLCEREKAKSRFLDVMLICPSILPQSWGGQHICQLTESEPGSLLVPVMAVDEIALLHPTLSESVPSQWTRYLRSLANEHGLKPQVRSHTPKHDLTQRTEENKEQMVKPEKSPFKAEKSIGKRKDHVNIAASLAEGEPKDYDNVDSKDLNEYLSQLGRTEEGLEKQKSSTAIKRSTATEALAEPSKSKKGQHGKRLEKEISDRRLLPLKDLAKTQEDLSPTTETPLLREKERGEGESKKYSKEESVKVIRRKPMKEKAMPSEPKSDHSTKGLKSDKMERSSKIRGEASIKESDGVVLGTSLERKPCKTPDESTRVRVEERITVKQKEVELGTKKKEEILATKPRIPQESSRIREQEKPAVKPKEELVKPIKEEVSTAVTRTPQESSKIREQEKPAVKPKEELVKPIKEEVVSAVSRTPQESPKLQKEAKSTVPKEQVSSKMMKEVSATVATAQEITKKAVECSKKDDLGKKIEEMVTAIAKTPKESTKIQKEEKLLLKTKEDELGKRKKEELTTAPGEREASTKRKETLPTKETPLEDDLGKKKKELILAAVFRTPQESSNIPKEKKAPMKPEEIKLVEPMKKEVLTAVSRTPLGTPKMQREAKPTVKPKENELDKPVKKEIMTASTPKDGAERRGEIKLIEEKFKGDELCKPKKEEVLNAVSKTFQEATRKRTEERLEDKTNELSKKKEEPVRAVPQTPQESAKIQREERPVEPKEIEPSRQKEEGLKAGFDKQEESTKKRKEEEKRTEPKVEKKDDRQTKEEFKAVFGKRQENETHRNKEALMKERSKLDVLSVPKKEEIPMAIPGTPKERVEERSTVKLKEHVKKEQSPMSIPENVDERKEILPEKAQDEKANVKKVDEPPVAAEKFVKDEEKEELKKQILAEMLQKTQDDDSGTFLKVTEDDRKATELTKKEKEVGKSCDNEKFESAKKSSKREHKKGEKSTTSDEAHAKLEKEKRRTHEKMEKRKTSSKEHKRTEEHVVDRGKDYATQKTEERIERSPGAHRKQHQDSAVEKHAQPRISRSKGVGKKKNLTREEHGKDQKIDIEQQEKEMKGRKKVSKRSHR